MGRIEARLQSIPVEPRALADYHGRAPAESVDRAAELAEPLAGARVLYARATPFEAADGARSLAPLLEGLGLEAERALLHGDRDFQLAAHELADGLRGAAWGWGEGRWRAFREACEGAAVAADLRRYDAVIIQGAGAAPLIEGRRSGAAGWLWRTGVDASTPEGDCWSALEPLLSAYSTLCLALPDYAPPGLGGRRLRIVPGGFDPLAAAQRDLSAAELTRLAGGLGLDLERPLIVHLGVLDAWADPLASVQSWFDARAAVPGLQLAVAGGVDPSDPEAVALLDELSAFAGEDPDLHLLTDRGGFAGEELNAAGRLARGAVHATLGEQFEPALAASLWRGTAMIADGSSARAQLRDGHDGFLASDPGERTAAIVELAEDPARAVEMGLAGRESARLRFSLPRLLEDELELLGALLSPAAAAAGERSAVAA